MSIIDTVQVMYFFFFNIRYYFFKVIALGLGASC